MRPHGETSAVITVFAPGQGRHAGLVRGGSQPKMRSALQPGSRVQASWRARLAETLGYMTIEPVRSTAALVLDDGLRLAGLASICALLDGCLAEREAQPALYAATRSLLDLVCIEDAQHRWIEGYVRWEVGLLQCIGYSLDLERCAVTGATEGLVHVSPKSGRAVSRGAAGKFADRMLLLPAFLGGAPDGIDAAASGAGGTASGDVAAGDTQGAGEGAAAASGGATGGATAGDHASAGDATGHRAGRRQAGRRRHAMQIGRQRRAPRLRARACAYRLFFREPGFRLAEQGHSGTKTTVCGKGVWSVWRRAGITPAQDIRRWCQATSNGKPAASGGIATTTGHM